MTTFTLHTPATTHAIATDIRNFCYNIAKQFGNGSAKYREIIKSMACSDTEVLKKTADFAEFSRTVLGGDYKFVSPKQVSEMAKKISQKRQNLRIAGKNAWSSAETLIAKAKTYKKQGSDEKASNAFQKARMLKGHAKAVQADAKLPEDEFVARYFGVTSASHEMVKRYSGTAPSMDNIEADENNALEEIKGIDVAALFENVEGDCPAIPCRNPATAKRVCNTYMPIAASRYTMDDDMDTGVVVNAATMEKSMEFFTHQLITNRAL